MRLECAFNEWAPEKMEEEPQAPPLLPEGGLKEARSQVQSHTPEGVKWLADLQ